MTETTSRPASGTTVRACYRGSAHSAHTHTSNVYPHPEYQCPGVEQAAEPVKLWHPADVDPFAQFDDDVENVAALYADHCGQQATEVGARTCAFPGDQEHDHAMCEDVVAEETAVPIAEALAPYEQRRQTRKARKTLPELIADATPRLNHQQGNYGISILFGLGQPGREKHVYGGTVPTEVTVRRRAKNRVARRSRRINRRSA